MNSDKKTNRRSIYQNIGIAYGLIFGISLLLICGIIITVNYNKQKNSSLSLSNDIVKARSAEIGQWLKSYLEGAKIISTESIFKSGDMELIGKRVSEIQQKNFDENYDPMAFVDKNGDFISANGAKGNVTTRQYYQEIMINKKDYFIGDPIISKVTGDYIFPVAYKVIGDNNQLIGLILTPIKLNYMSNVITNTKIGNSGSAWVIDSAGIVIAHSTDKEIVNNLNILKSNEAGFKGLEEAGKLMIEHKSGINEIFKKGAKEFIIYEPILNSAGWTMGVSIPASDLLKDAKSSIKIAAFVGLLLLLLVLLLTFLIAGRIAKPIKIMSKIAKELSLGNIELKGIEENNSDRKKILKRKDEISEIVESMNELISYIQEKEDIAKQMSRNDFTIIPKIVSEQDAFGIAYSNLVKALNITFKGIMQNIEQVTSGSNQVAQASQALSQGATEQAGSLEEITSSITEINSQSKQNSDNAIEASGLAKKSMGNAENGNEQMKKLVLAMGEINKSADEIKRIVKVIDDIAFQTNLLALNANVEAARAGKYGKGFAVVAEEVRNLASRSAESVKETTEMVEKAIKNISSGNNLVEVTASQLEEIMDSASKVADLVEEISTASKEQTLGLEQINQGLGQIDQVTQENTASAEESASASEELASQAEELRTKISKFKLKNNLNENSTKNSEISSELINKLKREINDEYENGQIGVNDN